MPLHVPSFPRTLRVTHPVVHLREEPSNNAELASQALLGHTVMVHREQDGWVWVETDDTYRGWADGRWLRPDEPRDLADARKVSAIFADVRAEPQTAAPLLTRLSLLSLVSCIGDESRPGWQCIALPRTDAPGNATGYVPVSSLSLIPDAEPEDVAAWAAQHAEEFRGTPYLWGGSSSWGLDCSGLVQICYRLAGVTLRRDADLQRDDPRFVPVAFDELAPGDLVFFGKPDRITHVGMHRGPGEFIHSAGGAGVIVSPWGDTRYSPSFVDARRLDPARAGEPVTRFESETR